MNTIQNILVKNEINKEVLLKIKGGNGNNTSLSTFDEDAMGNVMRSRTSGLGGKVRPKTIGD